MVESGSEPGHPGEETSPEKSCPGPNGGRWITPPPEEWGWATPAPRSGHPPESEPVYASDAEAGDRPGSSPDVSSSGPLYEGDTLQDDARAGEEAYTDGGEGAHADAGAQSAPDTDFYGRQAQEAFMAPEPEVLPDATEARLNPVSDFPDGHSDAPGSGRYGSAYESSPTASFPPVWQQAPSGPAADGGTVLLDERFRYPQLPAAPGQEIHPRTAAPARKRNWPKRILRDVVVPLAIAFMVAMMFQAVIAKPYQIPSGSMLPTIQLSDRILADRIIYHFRSIHHGDVIVFDPPPSAQPDPDTPYVKRVIGLPGDTVEVRDNRVFVNGQEYTVPAAAAPTYTMAAETVPPDELFVLGDNRNESFDSHKWGFVPEENVIGRADLIYWPIPHITLLGN